MAKKPSPNIAVKIPLNIIPDDKKYLKGTLSATIPLLVKKLGKLRKLNVNNYETIKNINYTMFVILGNHATVGKIEFKK